MAFSDAREMVERLRSAEVRISAERGSFILFALFHRENALFDDWDVVFSAPWADAIPSLDAYRIVDTELKKDLPLVDVRRFARYVVIPTDFPDLDELYEEHPVEHGKVIVRNREFGEQFIRKGYVITCRAPLKKAA